MKLSEAPLAIVKNAVLASGIGETEAHWIAVDFLSDTYWNDPKCAKRRIMVAGGDHIRFFNYLDDIDWGN